MSDNPSSHNRGVNMSAPEASGPDGCASEPPTPVTSSNPADGLTTGSTPQRVMALRDEYDSPQKHARRPHSRRRPPGQIRAGDPPHPLLPDFTSPYPALRPPPCAVPHNPYHPLQTLLSSSKERYSLPTVSSKRAADHSSDGLAPAAKKQAKTSTTSEDAFDTPIDSPSNASASPSSSKQSTEQQTVDGSGARENAGVAVETVQSQSQDMKKMDSLLEEMQRLSAKVDSLVERFDVMDSRQTDGDRTAELASSAVVTHLEPTDIEMYGRSLHW